MNKVIRHGEAMLVPIRNKVVGEEHTSFVIAHSETGHHHVLESAQPFVIQKDADKFFIQLFTEAKLVHKKTTDKHNTLTIAPGKYRVTYKNEYDPFAKVIRRVTD